MLFIPSLSQTKPVSTATTERQSERVPEPASGSNSESSSDPENESESGSETEDEDLDEMISRTRDLGLVMTEDDHQEINTSRGVQNYSAAPESVPYVRQDFDDEVIDTSTAARYPFPQVNHYPEMGPDGTYGGVNTSYVILQMTEHGQDGNERHIAYPPTRYRVHSGQCYMPNFVFNFSKRQRRFDRDHRMIPAQLFQLFFPHLGHNEGQMRELLHNVTKSWNVLNRDMQMATLNVQSIPTFKVRFEFAFQYNFRTNQPISFPEFTFADFIDRTNHDDFTDLWKEDIKQHISGLKCLFEKVPSDPRNTAREKFENYPPEYKTRMLYHMERYINTLQIPGSHGGQLCKNIALLPNYNATHPFLNVPPDMIIPFNEERKERTGITEGLDPTLLKLPLLGNPEINQLKRLPQYFQESIEGWVHDVSCPMPFFHYIGQIMRIIHTACGRQPDVDIGLFHIPDFARLEHRTQTQLEALIMDLFENVWMAYDMEWYITIGERTAAKKRLQHIHTETHLSDEEKENRKKSFQFDYYPKTHSTYLRWRDWQRTTIMTQCRSFDAMIVTIQSPRKLN